MNPVKKNQFILLPRLIIFAIFLAACQGQASSESTNPRPASGSIESTKVIPPPVIKTIPAPSSDASFVPAPTDVGGATKPTSSPGVPYPDPRGDDISTVTPTLPEVQPGLLPTFTAPPQPETSSWDHYWFRRPVPEGTSVWTDKAYPYGSSRGGALRPHHGVEFNVPRGTEVMAASSGRVIMAGEDIDTVVGPEPEFYGKVVIIQHDFTLNNQPVYSLYGHLSEILVETDQEVQSGDVIALSGASGVADGPHLHFETRVGENEYHSTRNPLLWLYPFPDRGVVAGLITWPDGEVAPEVPITLRRLDAESPYTATTSYAESSVNSDDNWGENFALDDVVAGYYLLIVGAGEDKTQLELWVYPNQTNFVQIQLGE
ncbi:MAG: hypothetical protein BMS9Abin02_1079 [Anaerolineae bacterium]|nr:MAG: hypothetical protein BMS9Abin02_1079 [Anaerolineae bacterium]